MSGCPKLTDFDFYFSPSTSPVGSYCSFDYIYTDTKNKITKLNKNGPNKHRVADSLRKKLKYKGWVRILGDEDDLYKTSIFEEPKKPARLKLVESEWHELCWSNCKCDLDSKS